MSLSEDLTHLVASIPGLFIYNGRMVNKKHMKEVQITIRNHFSLRKIGYPCFIFFDPKSKIIGIKTF